MNRRQMMASTLALTSASVLPNLSFAHSNSEVGTFSTSNVERMFGSLEEGLFYSTGGQVRTRNSGVLSVAQEKALISKVGPTNPQICLTSITARMQSIFPAFRLLAFPYAFPYASDAHGFLQNENVRRNGYGCLIKRDGEFIPNALAKKTNICVVAFGYAGPTGFLSTNSSYRSIDQIKTLETPTVFSPRPNDELEEVYIKVGFKRFVRTVAEMKSAFADNTPNMFALLSAGLAYDLGNSRNSYSINSIRPVVYFASLPTDYVESFEQDVLADIYETGYNLTFTNYIGFKALQSRIFYNMSLKGMHINRDRQAKTIVQSIMESVDVDVVSDIQEIGIADSLQGFFKWRDDSLLNPVFQRP